MNVEEFWSTDKYIAVHCSTKEKFDKFLNRLAEVTDTNIDDTTWGKYCGEETCISHNSAGMIVGREYIFRDFYYKIIEFEELADFWTMPRFSKYHEVQALIERAMANSLKLKVFVNEIAQVLLIPEFNIHFCLTGLKTAEAFKGELLCRLITYANNPDILLSGKDARLEGFINYMLDTSFTKEDFETIYSKLGKEIGYASRFNLCFYFIENNCDMSRLKRYYEDIMK